MARSPDDWLTSVQSMQKEMERWLNYLGSSKPPSGRFARMWEPAVDVYETATEVVVLMELAGVKQSDIEVVVEDNTLVVRGQRRDATPGAKKTYYQMEIHRGPFERGVLLPAEVDPNRTRASFEDGILEVVLPKLIKESTLRVRVRNLDQS